MTSTLGVFGAASAGLGALGVFGTAGTSGCTSGASTFEMGSDSESGSDFGLMKLKSSKIDAGRSRFDVSGFGRDAGFGGSGFRTGGGVGLSIIVNPLKMDIGSCDWVFDCRKPPVDGNSGLSGISESSPDDRGFEFDDGNSGVLGFSTSESSTECRFGFIDGDRDGNKGSDGLAVSMGRVGGRSLCHDGNKGVRGGSGSDFSDFSECHDGNSGVRGFSGSSATLGGVGMSVREGNKGSFRSRPLPLMADLGVVGRLAGLG